jgi:hypothetical protein
MGRYPMVGILAAGCASAARPRATAVRRSAAMKSVRELMEALVPPSYPGLSNASNVPYQPRPKAVGCMRKLDGVAGAYEIPT